MNKIFANLILKLDLLPSIQLLIQMNHPVIKKKYGNWKPQRVSDAENCSLGITRWWGSYSNMFDLTQEYSWKP